MRNQPGIFLFRLCMVSHTYTCMYTWCMFYSVDQHVWLFITSTVSNWVFEPLQESHYKPGNCVWITDVIRNISINWRLKILNILVFVNTFGKLLFVYYVATCIGYDTKAIQHIYFLKSSSKRPRPPPPLPPPLKEKKYVKKSRKKHGLLTYVSMNTCLRLVWLGAFNVEKYLYRLDTQTWM